MPHGNKNHVFWALTKKGEGRNPCSNGFWQFFNSIITEAPNFDQFLPIWARIWNLPSPVLCICFMLITFVFVVTLVSARWVASRPDLAFLLRLSITETWANRSCTCNKNIQMSKKNYGFFLWKTFQWTASTGNCLLEAPGHHLSLLHWVKIKFKARKIQIFRSARKKNLNHF